MHWTYGHIVELQSYGEMVDGSKFDCIQLLTVFGFSDYKFREVQTVSNDGIINLINKRIITKKKEDKITRNRNIRRYKIITTQNSTN